MASKTYLRHLRYANIAGGQSVSRFPARQKLLLLSGRRELCTSASAAATRPLLNTKPWPLKAAAACITLFNCGRGIFGGIRGDDSPKGVPEVEEPVKQLRWRLVGEAFEVPLKIALCIVFPATVALYIYCHVTEERSQSFITCAVQSIEEVSSTSFVLTVVPTVNGIGCLLGESWKRDILCAWAYGLWSVEIKHPLMQIAREYTPLPPLQESDKEQKSGTLRFLIRRHEGGVMSTYLSSLRPGDAVELRGPHLGFDVRARLGLLSSGKGIKGREIDGEQKREVIFLAAGTGIAPAMQVARAVLDDTVPAAQPAKKVDKEYLEQERRKLTGSASAHVRILWANRQRADCVGCEALLDGPFLVDKLYLEKVDPIIAQLAAMRRKYGADRLRVSCTVDEEGTFITEQAIAQALTTTSAATSSTGKKWPWEWLCLLPTKTATEDKSHLFCLLHSPLVLSTSTSQDDSKNPLPYCCCGSLFGSQGQGGKNLLMVSGPEGFVAMFAGPTVWDQGLERQGKVGGVLARLMGRHDRLRERWLALKQ